MKNFLIFFLTSYLMCNLLIAGETLTVKETSLKDRTLYELQLHLKNEVHTIWSKEVKFIDGEKPAEECGLWQWEKNDKGMIVVLSYDGFEGRFLQFDLNHKLMAELYLGYYWFKEMAKGAKIKLEPPDKIWLDNHGTLINEFKITNGVLYDKNGKDCSTLQYIKVNPGLQPDK